MLPAGTIELGAALSPVADGIEAQTGEEWPVDASGGDASPVFVYSLLLATFLGTMGLPHILVRFYTNPDGPAARRTTVACSACWRLYAFPIVYGLLGRVLVPSCTDRRDRLGRAGAAGGPWPGLGGEILGALVAAGAFAAFMSTASGLMVSVAGTISFDLWRRGNAGMTVRRRRFGVAALGARGRAGGAGAGGPWARHLGARRLGVRARRQHVLPAAAARHLVGAPRPPRRGDRPGRGRRHGHRPDLRGARDGGRPPDGRRPAHGSPPVLSVPVAFAAMVPGAAARQARTRSGRCRPARHARPGRPSARADEEPSFAHRIGAA